MKNPSERFLETAADIEDPDSGRARPKLVVAGCLPVRYAGQLENELPEVDLWLPPEAYPTWPEAVAALLELSKTPKKTSAVRPLSTPPGYAYLKICEGCDPCLPLLHHFPPSGVPCEALPCRNSYGKHPDS